jgi:hypothetical protein
MIVVFAFRHLAKRGTRVIVAHDDVRPVQTTNPHLFKPKAVSGSPEFPTVAGRSIGTAAATQGSPCPATRLRKSLVIRRPAVDHPGYAPAFSRSSGNATKSPDSEARSSTSCVVGVGRCRIYPQRSPT